MKKKKKEKIHQHTKHSYARKAKSDTQSHRVPHWFTIVWNRIWAACQLKRSFGYVGETPRPLRVLTRDWTGQKRVKSSSQLNELTHVLLSLFLALSFSLSRAYLHSTYIQSCFVFVRPTGFLSFVHLPSTCRPSSTVPRSRYYRWNFWSPSPLSRFPSILPILRTRQRHQCRVIFIAWTFDENFWMKISESTVSSIHYYSYVSISYMLILSINDGIQFISIEYFMLSR